MMRKMNGIRLLALLPTQLQSGNYAQGCLSTFTARIRETSR